MPELPEVESVCRVLRRALVGETIAAVDVVSDPIVFGGHAPRALVRAFLDRDVASVGRKGKFFWIAMHGEGPTVYAHLGISGWVRALGVPGTRLQSHGEAPLDDPDGEPRFLRLRLRTKRGRSVVFTDARRFGRIWLGGAPEDEPRVARLGPDAYDDLPPAGELAAILARRRRAIKAVLLDQGVLAGIGNWIADEVLYQSRIAPTRLASSLSLEEVRALRRAVRSVLDRAVAADANKDRFPKTWLFERRWGGTRGADRIGGARIVREIVGGRTTAWVPTRQR